MLTYINCRRAFVWEMTYPLESSNGSGGGNILLIKIKIKCQAGKNLEIITFRYLKTLVFSKFFKKYYIIWCFYFWRILLVIKRGSLWLFDIVPHIHLSPPFISGKLTWPQKILEFQQICNIRGVLIHQKFYFGNMHLYEIRPVTYLW